MNTTIHFIFKTAICFGILFISASAFSQKTSIRYIGSNGKITNVEHALKMERISTKSAKKAIVQTLLLKDSNWEKITTDQYHLVNDSTYRISENSKDFTGKIYRKFIRLPNQMYRFKDILKGKIVREGTAQSIMPLLLQGEVTEFYKTGNKKSISQYSNNELISNKNWDEKGNKYIDNIFFSVDVDPTFQPGAGMINKRLISAFKAAGIDLSSISGSLVIGFVVMEDGRIDGIRILKGLGQTINTVAYQTFANLKGSWTPAQLNNQPVRYFQVFPINFIDKTQSFEFLELRGSTLHWGAY